MTVAVRVRPMNKREIALGTVCCIDMQNNQTILKQIDGHVAHKSDKVFAFDYSFWSMDPREKRFADQESVFDNVGQRVLNNSMQGFNACIFAYGQTGSGKSYSMMGCPGKEGIIPRISAEMFKFVEEKTSDSLSFKLEVSYLEIYNEKVRDLLNPSNKKALKVREHASTGPYVDGLVKTVVANASKIAELIDEGGKSRTVAATNMNSESSRSHSVFTVNITQEEKVGGLVGEKCSRLSLVDLAGSERASKTGAAGDRLKEGSNINKSLSTLGLVISALATGKSKFVPYRDSVLTWLLKDCLGGNSKTVMVAAISPSADNYEETLSTLRYADRAKKIVNKAVVNEDPNTKIIRELREEVAKLKAMLGGGAASPGKTEKVEMKEQLKESEKLLSEVEKPWDERVRETEQTNNRRQETLQSMGISLSSKGIKMSGKQAFLVNLHPDQAMTEMLVYNLPDSGDALIGSSDKCYIRLQSFGIEEHHATITVDGEKVSMMPQDGAMCCINGVNLTERTALRSGDRLLWGSNHYFKLTIPWEKIQTLTPANESVCDFEAAQREVMMNQLPDGARETIQQLENQILDDDGATTVITGVNEKERSHYEDVIGKLQNELSVAKKESPAKREKKARRQRLKEGVRLLKGDLARAQHMVMEANSLCDRLGKAVKFSVTLRIPPSRLGPSTENEARLLCQAAIKLQRPGREDNIWDVEKLEERMSEMRFEILSINSDNSDEFSESSESTARTPMSPDSRPDPFADDQQQTLVGVASFYLESLFYDLNQPFDYTSPIVSPNGSSAGKLRVRLERIAGRILVPEDEEYFSPALTPSESSDEITVRVEVIEAIKLSPTLAHFVECQYQFPGTSYRVSVHPVIDETMSPRTDRDRLDVRYRDSKEFTINLEPNVLGEFERGALNIEVLGHQDRYRAREKREEAGIDWRAVEEEGRSLAERWGEVSRRVKVDVEIQELEDGHYQPVEIEKPETSCGGVYQLRAGMSRRLLISTTPLMERGHLPLVLGEMTSAQIGSILIDGDNFSEIKTPDSYQEHDLANLREKWSVALDERKSLLDIELQKEQTDLDRESALFQQVAVLAEERNAVLVPQSESGMPGAPEPDDIVRPMGFEQHVPVLYLGLDQDSSEDTIPGARSLLPGEDESKMINLSMIKNCWGEQGGTHAVFAWDSSVHDHQNLNKPDGKTQVYLIVTVKLRVSLPVEKEIVMRKRIQVEIQPQRRGLMQSLKKNLRLSSNIRYTKNSVVYEIISTLPLPAENMTLDAGADDLAEMAANTARERTDSTSEEMWDPNTAFDRYVKSLQTVERILDIERIKQQAALHRMIDDLGIPKLFSRRNKFVESILSPGPEARPPPGLHQLRPSQTMPSISNFRDPLIQEHDEQLDEPTKEEIDLHSELHAVPRLCSNFSTGSNHSGMMSPAVSDLSPAVSDLSADDSDDSDSDDSDSDDDSDSESDSDDSDSSSDSDDSNDQEPQNSLTEAKTISPVDTSQFTDLSNLHGSAK